MELGEGQKPHSQGRQSYCQAACTCWLVKAPSGVVLNFEVKPLALCVAG